MGLKLPADLLTSNQHHSPRPLTCVVLRVALVKALREGLFLCVQLKLPRDDLYLPTNAHYRVRAIIPESATPMQSAAKVPILVAFQVRLLDYSQLYGPWK